MSARYDGDPQDLEPTAADLGGAPCEACGERVCVDGVCPATVVARDVEWAVYADELHAFAVAERDDAEFSTERTRRAYDQTARALARRVRRETRYQAPKESEAAE